MLSFLMLSIKNIHQDWARDRKDFFSRLSGYQAISDRLKLLGVTRKKKTFLYQEKKEEKRKEFVINNKL